MVTGDNLHTAKAIARECGILTDGVAIEGPAFRDTNPEEMRKLIPNLQVDSFILQFISLLVSYFPWYAVFSYSVLYFGYVTGYGKGFA